MADVIVVAHAKGIIGEKPYAGIDRRRHEELLPPVKSMTSFEPHISASSSGNQQYHSISRDCQDCQLHVTRMPSAPFGFIYSLDFGKQTDHRPALVWTHAQVRQHLRNAFMPRNSFITGWRTDHRFGVIEISEGEAECLLNLDAR